MPVGRAVASVASTWPIGTAAVLTKPVVDGRAPARPAPRWETARIPARASRGIPASWTVPQAWHSPHRPLHLADCQPHSVQRKPDAPDDDLAMARTLAVTSDNLSKLEPNLRRESA